MNLKQGTQVAYIPTHAHGDIDHEAVEFGFVTKVDVAKQVAWVRYWKGDPSKTMHRVLRTTGNSERSRLSLLSVCEKISRRLIDRELYRLNYITREEFTLRQMGW